MDCWKARNKEPIQNVSKVVVMVGGAAAAAAICTTGVGCFAAIGLATGAASYAASTDPDEWDNADFITETVGNGAGAGVGGAVAKHTIKKVIREAKPRYRATVDKNGNIIGWTRIK